MQAGVGGRAAPAQDTTAPLFTDFDIPTTSVDVRFDDQPVEFTMGITDDLSGFASSTVEFGSPTGQTQLSVDVTAADRTSGDALDGTYDASALFPQFSEVGTWGVKSITLGDQDGNEDELSQADRALYERARKLQNFLTQPFIVAEVFSGMKGKYVSLEKTLDGCERILAGRVDQRKEEEFYMIGALPWAS